MGLWKHCCSGLNTVELLKISSSALNIGPQVAMNIAERLYTSGLLRCRTALRLRCLHRPMGRPVWQAARSCGHQMRTAIVHTTNDCTARLAQFPWRLRGLVVAAATRARRAPPTPPASSSARRCRTTRGTPSGATTRPPSCPQASRRPRQAPQTLPTSLI